VLEFNSQEEDVCTDLNWAGRCLERAVELSSDVAASTDEPPRRRFRNCPLPRPSSLSAPTPRIPDVGGARSFSRMAPCSSATRGGLFSAVGVREVAAEVGPGEAGECGRGRSVFLHAGGRRAPTERPWRFELPGGPQIRP
jgi:hypothetical protein